MLNKQKNSWGRTARTSLKLDLYSFRHFSLEILLRDGVGGCHKLTGNRKDQYAMHLNEPFRLIFTVRVVNNATIIEIVDYHKK